MGGKNEKIKRVSDGKCGNCEYSRLDGGRLAWHFPGVTPAWVSDGDDCKLVEVSE